MDEIRIKNLEVFGHHGVYPEETKLGQKFLVSCILFLNTRQAGIHDDINRTVSYGATASLIRRCMEEKSYQLVEAAAEHLAEELLLFHDSIRQADVEIKKPWAPVGIPLEYVSVRIRRKWHEVYIGMGSNMGDRINYIRQAVDGLGHTRGCIIAKMSELIETEPYGGIRQENFLNGVIKIYTILEPGELLKRLHELEGEAGRERLVRWGPRTLDLDILFYDNDIIEEEDLIIPHKDLIHREFVLKPMKEIASLKKHPVYGATISELLERLHDK